MLCVHDKGRKYIPKNCTTTMFLRERESKARRIVKENKCNAKDGFMKYANDCWKK